jgi:hypothetical protein
VRDKCVERWEVALKWQEERWDQPWATLCLDSHPPPTIVTLQSQPPGPHASFTGPCPCCSPVFLHFLSLSSDLWSGDKKSLWRQVTSISHAWLNHQKLPVFIHFDGPKWHFIWAAQLSYLISQPSWEVWWSHVHFSDEENEKLSCLSQIAHKEMPE